MDSPKNASIPPDESPTEASGSGPVVATTAPVQADLAQPDPAQKEAGKKKEKKEDEDNSESPMTLFDHLREMRARLIKILVSIVVGFMVCYFFSEYLADIIYMPLVVALPDNAGSSIIFTGVAEGFFTHMKIAFVAGMFLTSPYIFYQIWSFIAPGLYAEEKIYILPIAFCSAFFFVLGGCFCYFIVFPNAFTFFMTYSKGPFQAMPGMSEYFSFALQLIIAFGLIFELPLFSFFLAKIGLVSAASMRRFRRYFVVLAFVIAAILTPPEVISQLLMAIPMLILYEVSIIIAALVGKNKDKRKEEAMNGAEERARE